MHSIAEKVVMNITIEPNLIPILLVPIPSGLDGTVAFAQLNGTIHITLHCGKVGLVQANARKNLSLETTNYYRFIKRHPP